MHRSIDTIFWKDKKIKALAYPAKLLMIYLVTNDSSHVSGIYPISLGAIRMESGIPAADLDPLKNTLSEQSLCFFDDENQIVWVCNMMKHQGKGPKNTLSAAAHIVRLALRYPKCPLLKDFADKYPAVKAEIPRYAALHPEFQGKIPYGKPDTLSGYPIDTLSKSSRSKGKGIPVLEDLSLTEDLSGEEKRENGETLAALAPKTGYPIDTLSKASVKSERPKNISFEIFAAVYDETHTPDRYARKGKSLTFDFVRLAEMKERLGVSTDLDAVPKDWEIACRNYCASDLSKFTLADLCGRYGIFVKAPVDRFGKPITTRATTERRVNSNPDHGKYSGFFGNDDDK